MNLQKLQTNPSKFRDFLLIDTDNGPVRLRDCLDDWQQEDFAALDDGWRRAVLGAKQEARYQRGWLERPRGHSKTQDIAVMATWALFASKRRISGVAAAGDADQARLLRDAIGRLCYVNPWLDSVLEVQTGKIINKHTGSVLEVISSDAPTSYGLLVDFVICDELTHWVKRDLWDSLLSSAAKRSTCMLLVIANAGMRDDWAWETREAVRQNDSWYFSRLEGPVASWIDADKLAEQESLLPSIAYRRLWLNEWTSGGGDALTEDVINDAFDNELQPMDFPHPDYDYVCGIDLGVSRDASAVCALGIMRNRTGHGKIRLANTKIWKPSKGKKVDLQAVENFIRELHARFGFQQLNYDSWQAAHMASRLQSAGMGTLVFGRAEQRKSILPVVEVPPTGKHLQAQATVLIEAFNARRVQLYDEPNLRRDLHRLRVEERPYGFRLVSPRDEHGHGDLASAFALALLAASEIASQSTYVVGSGNISQGEAMTGYENALHTFHQNQIEFEREQEEFRNDRSGSHENMINAIAQSLRTHS